MRRVPEARRRPHRLRSYERFQRPSQKLDVFNRAAWDDTVRSDKAIRFFWSCLTDLTEFKKVGGFTHRDFVLRNASWYIADMTADLFEASHDRKEGFLDECSRR